MLKKLYEKYKEIVDYLFWGVMAFILSMVLYWVFDSLLGWSSVVANTVDWIIVVIFAFFTNKLFVFRSKSNKPLKEFVEFVAARFFTLILEDIIIFIGVDLMGHTSTIGSLIVKLIGQVVVIVVNYIFSKLIIFKEKK